MANIPAIRFKGFTDPWEQRKLGDIAEVTMGQSPSGTCYTDNPNDAILVQGNADLKNGWVYPRVWTTEITKTASRGDLIMSVRAPVGAMGKTAFDVVLGRGVAGIKGDEFLFQALSKIESDGYWTTVSAGSTFDSISGDELRNTAINYLSDTEERKRIGYYFQKFDHLITLHQRKYEKLSVLKKSLLEKMFPREGENKPEVRFAGFTDPWEQRKLGNVTRRVTRKNEGFESQLPLTISAQYGLVDQTAFFNNRVASADLSGYYLLHRGEFAYNKSTSADSPWGAVKRLERYEKGCVSTLYIVFEALNINPQFLVTYYETGRWHKGIQAIAAEGARNHGLLNIAPSDFFETELTVPLNKAEQRKIGEFFSQLDTLITLHQRKLEKLKQLKQSLLEKMFV